MEKLKEKNSPAGIRQQKNEVAKQMMEKFGYKNIMATPRIKKVVINTGFGKLISGQGSDIQRKIQEALVTDLTTITGQRAVLTKAKKSIAAFKLRQGMPVGVKVTLRGSKMYDFLDRFMNVVLPRVRDFRGLNFESFDDKGNMTIGIKEHTVFPEILPEKVRYGFGFEVVISTGAKSKEEGREFLKLLGFPIKKRVK